MTETPASRSLFSRVTRKLRYKSRPKEDPATAPSPSSLECPSFINQLSHGSTGNRGEQDTISRCAHDHRDCASTNDSSETPRPECLICLETFQNGKATIPMGVSERERRTKTSSDAVIFPLSFQKGSKKKLMAHFLFDVRLYAVCMPRRRWTRPLGMQDRSCPAFILVKLAGLAQ